jgi:hypothetical protein
VGRYCRICGCERPNEQFSGKGHKIHVCKRCKARPKSERQAVEDRDDIFAFLEQSHISEKNVARLERIAKSDNPQVASLAAIVLDVARVKPHKTRRLKFLAQKRPELLGKLRDMVCEYACPRLAHFAAPNGDQALDAFVGQRLRPKTKTARSGAS